MLKAFDSWKEIYALALTRVMGYVPLKRVKAVWEKLYSDLDPNLSPKKLSEVLKEVGLNREAQNAVFRALMNDKHFVYDLSVVFTRSSMNLAEIGYNKDRIHVPQINLALLHSVRGLPAMIRPGSVKDVVTLYAMKKSGQALTLSLSLFLTEASFLRR